jgi:hypothetical protein
MSNEEQVQTIDREATDEGTEKIVRESKVMAPTSHGRGSVSKATDFAARPGFRDASNKRSKATRKQRKKK